ncbi:MAG TPA: sigma-70 family RNA polymerase sigma factor [Spirochaetota bacterium]|nr:sigma-70 family RNA polymerase sigma factor [Spirochaetota bacterium]
MNETDFSLIVKSTKKVVLSAIEKTLAERFYHAIDDVAQETYIRAYRGLVKNSFRADSSIETWLYVIARNESLRMNRKLMREEEKALRSARHTVKENDTAPDTAILHDSINALPEKYRPVLQMMAEGLRINEISAKLGIRPGTVKSRASRGKKIIQDRTGTGHERE